mgnify:CR=1 FL=1
MIPPSIIETLNAGGVVAYPTSTQPGLASLPTSQGLDALFTLKQRPDTMPVSLGVATVEQAKKFVQFPELAEQLISNFEKGALTLILPAQLGERRKSRMARKPGPLATSFAS